MADQKHMRAISRVAVSGDIGRNEIAYESVEHRKQFCEFDFHEIHAAFCETDKSAAAFSSAAPHSGVISQ
jgi:hypothetical protein